LLVAGFEPELISIVGCGGTGTHLIPPLCRYLNAEKYEGIIKFVDGDKYEESNLNRQEIHESAIGQNKASALADAYNEKYEDLSIVAYPWFVGKSNIDNVVTDNSVILVAADNYTVRRQIIEKAVTTDNTVVIIGGNDAYDGDVLFYVHAGFLNTPNPIDRHPELKNDDGDRSELSCEELSNLPGNPQTLVANLFAATAMFATFINIGDIVVRKNVKEIYFNTRSCAMGLVGADVRTVQIERIPNEDSEPKADIAEAIKEALK